MDDSQVKEENSAKIQEATEIVAPESSALGTQCYWESHYAEELELWSKHGDCGEIWFGTKREEQILHWFLSNSLFTGWKDPVFLDLGCGNGHFLQTIHEKIPSAILYGLDYSKNSIKFASELLSGNNVPIRELFVFDLMQDPMNQKNNFTNFIPGSVNAIVDKGTFDAISLSPTAEEDEEENRAHFIQNVVVPAYVKNLHFFANNSNNVFLLASCNWTVQELRSFFDAHLQFLHEIPALSSSSSANKFSFAGISGNSVSCVAFRV